jgi:hypothetical protein
MIQMIIAHRTNARCSDYASSHVFRTGSAALARNISIESTFEDRVATPTGDGLVTRWAAVAAALTNDPEAELPRASDCRGRRDHPRDRRCRRQRASD